MTNDDAFITGLMRQNYEALGFIPSPTVKSQYLAQGRYLVQTRNGKPVGYLLHGAPAPGSILTIAQHVIEYDWREKGYGMDVYRRLLDRAENANCRAIRLKCAEDLPSNAFWQAAGFEHIAVLTPDNKRQRTINVYELPLWPRLALP